MVFRTRWHKSLHVLHNSGDSSGSHGIMDDAVVMYGLGRRSLCFSPVSDLDAWNVFDYIPIKMDAA